MEVGVIAGIAVGCAAVLFLIVTVGYKFFRYIQRELDKEEGDSARANTTGLSTHVIAFTLPQVDSVSKTRETRTKRSFVPTPVTTMEVVDVGPGNPFEDADAPREPKYVGVTPGYLRKSTRRLRKSKRRSRV
jgi:hypothetical protein